MKKFNETYRKKFDETMLGFGFRRSRNVYYRLVNGKIYQEVSPECQKDPLGAAFIMHPNFSPICSNPDTPVAKLRSDSFLNNRWFPIYNKNEDYVEDYIEESVEEAYGFTEKYIFPLLDKCYDYPSYIKTFDEYFANYNPNPFYIYGILNYDKMLMYIALGEYEQAKKYVNIYVENAMESIARCEQYNIEYAHTKNFKPIVVDKSHYQIFDIEKALNENNHDFLNELIKQNEEKYINSLLSKKYKI